MSNKIKKHVPEGYLHDISEEQREVLKEFKSYIAETHSDLDPNIADDWVCLRFCRARKFKLKETIIMFDKYIAFNKKWDVYNLQSSDSPELIKELEENYRTTLYSQTNDGKLVIIERWGDVDYSGLIKKYSEEVLVRHFLRTYMKAIHCCFYKLSEHYDTIKDYFIFLVDLKGLSVSKILSSDIIKIAKLLTTSTADNFPEMMCKTFFINSPYMFTFAWKIARIWLDEKVVNKISILGTDYKKQLYQHVEEDKLPESCGGTCKATLEEGHPDRVWKDYLNECIEKKTYFADGIMISNPQNKYRERQRVEKEQKIKQEMDIDLDSDPTDTFFDEHVIVTKINRRRDANVDERMRNYKNVAACLSLTDRFSRADSRCTVLTSPNFVSPFGNNVFNFDNKSGHIHSMPANAQQKGFFVDKSDREIDIPY